jgi:hypothetical protein
MAALVTAPATDTFSRDALGKDKVFALAGYAPRTREVAEFHASTARTRIAHAPARTSKSFAAAHEAFYHCFPLFSKLADGKLVAHREPSGDRRIWLVGPDYRTIKEWDYLWDHVVVRRRRSPLGRLYRVTSKTNAPQHGNMKIVMEFPADEDGMPTRVIIEGKSAANPESLQGEQVYLAVLSEAAELDEKVLGRYLGTRCRYVLAPTTPKLSAEWLRKLIDEGAAHPELSIESFQFTPHANPEYDWDLYWIEHAKAESRVTGKIVTPARGHDCFANPAGCLAATDPWFAEQFQGQWAGADERLLPFGAAHLLDEVPSWANPRHAEYAAPRTFVSCDYGYADAAVALWWAIGEREHFVLLSEVYEQHLTATEFVAAIHGRSRALGLRPEYFVGDPKQPQIARLMRDRGLNVWDVDKRAMTDRAAGFHAIIDALSTDPVTNRPRLQLVTDHAGEPWGCPKTIHEWKHLRRRSGVAVGEWAPGAIAGDDHGADAARYGIMTRPQPRHTKPDDEIRRYVESLRRRAARPALPLAGRLVGGSGARAVAPVAS